MSKSLLPEKLYLGLYYSSEDSMIRALMTPYGTDKQSLSKINTLKNRIPGPARLKVEPQVIDNVPMFGFKIKPRMEFGSHFGSNSYSAVIEDPRGFETFLPVTSLAAMFSESIIQDGVILDECCWIRDRAENILVTTRSERYLEAKSNSQVRRMHDTWRNVRLGNRVLMRDNTSGIWLGKMYILTDRPGYIKKTTGENVLEWSADPLHVILDDCANGDPGRQIMHLKKTAQLAKILDSSQITQEEAELRANQAVHAPECRIESRTYYSPVALSASTYLDEDVKITLTPASISSFSELENVIDSFSGSRIFYKSESTNELVHVSRRVLTAGVSSNRYYGSHYKLDKISDNQICYATVPSKHTKSRLDIKFVQFTPDIADLYHMQLSFKTAAGAAIRVDY